MKIKYRGTITIMKRVIIEQSQQIVKQAQREGNKQMSRFCAFEIRNLDRLHDLLYSPLMDKFMVTVTSTGNLGCIWIFTALMLLISNPDHQIGYTMLIALLLGIAVGNLLIKNTVKRSRPFFHKNYKLLIKQPWDYSFPSGHTLASFSAATVLFYMNPWMGFVAYIYAAIIALSRLYLRVHFFTDVFFSMLLGIGLGVFSVYIYTNNILGIAEFLRYLRWNY
ncbi:MAG: phosphatase PAP2 family protein [Saccharofermentans sp.]|nr:phosphatase PAP2 family protein [Saccharofermentans sp.]